MPARSCKTYNHSLQLILFILSIGICSCVNTETTNSSQKSSITTSVTDSFVTKIKEPYVPGDFIKFPYYDFREDRHHFIKEAIEAKDPRDVRLLFIETNEALDSFFLVAEKFDFLEGIYVSGAKLNKNSDFDLLIDKLEGLEHFKKLILNGNWITSLPKGISRLKKLKTLDLSFNDFPEIPEEICTLKELEYLRLAKSKEFMRLPKNIGELNELRFLIFSGTSVKTIPSSIGRCKKLMHITANASQLRAIPDELGQCKNLRYINVGYAKLKEIPASFCGITDIESIAFGSNSISELPDEFSQLKQLRFCSLSNSKFKEFPEQILELKNLTNLLLHKNPFNRIPIELAELKDLKRFHIGKNDIKASDLDEIQKRRPDLLIVDQK